MDDTKPSIIDKFLDQKTTEFDSEQPPNIQHLAKISGKSPNAVNVEYDQEVRKLEKEQMQNPPAMTNNTDLAAMARIKAVDNLEDQYKSGQTEESDEVTYDELVGDITNDFGQSPEANEFNMFTPGEQDTADQMFADIDNINAENPYEEDVVDEPETALDSLDGLADIAENEDESKTKPMPNDSAPETPEDDFDEEIPDTPQLEGIDDVLKKFGKYAAMGALAFNAANSHAAPSDFRHETTSPDGKTTTVLASKTHKNLWQNQNYEDRVTEIFKQLKQKRIDAGKTFNEQILYNQAQMYAQAELATGKPWNGK